MYGDNDKLVDPTTYEEVIYDIDASKWQVALDSKMKSMHSNQVWVLVDSPEGIVHVGCKLIFKRNISSDGQVSTYKTRLVAKGYRQRQEIDYDETFSLVTMLKSIKMMLAITAYYDYEI